MLEGLLEAYGLSNRRAAQEAGISNTSIARYIGGARPSLTSASAIADLFNDDDASALLESWGYERRAEKLRTTHDPEVANGWRLDTLIAEIRQTNKILNRIEQHLAPKRPMPEGETE